MIDSTSSIFYFVLALAAAVTSPPQRAKHLTLVVSSSAAETKPGATIELTVELALDDNVHVYAPGAEGYLPVTWTLIDSPQWKSGPVHLPASKVLKLEAIGESAAVFDGKFSMTREVSFGKGATGDLTLKGTVRYQACDDRLCYRPDAVPVTWSVHIKR